MNIRLELVQTLHRSNQYDKIYEGSLLAIRDKHNELEAPILKLTKTPSNIVEKIMIETNDITTYI